MGKKTGARGDNTARNSHVEARKKIKMEKKLRELQKHYPNNKYEIKEMVSKPRKDKDIQYKVSAIVRTKGARPHKKKEVK